MNNRYYDNLFKKILNETLEEKANSLVNTLKLNKKSEFDYVQEDFDDVLGVHDSEKYKRTPKFPMRHQAKKAAEKDMTKHFKKPGNPWTTDVDSSEDWPKHKLPYDTKFNFDELSEGKEVCNECGVGKMMEGECNECGYKKMSMKEKWDKEVEVEKTGEHTDKTVGELKKELSRLKDVTEKYKEHGDRVPKSFRKRMSELIFAIRAKKDWPKGHMEEGKQVCDECGVGMMREGQCNECGYKKMSMDEELSGGQKYIAKQAKPYDKIDANDFKKLRNKKTETKESGFPDLSGDNEVTKKDILIAKGVLDKKGNKIEKKQNETFYRIYSGEESALFTENEVIDMIEQFVNEEKQKFKKGQTPAGYAVYEKAVKQSKKENDDYINSVLKKLKEYTKPGSKTTYDMNPEGFPKGNGEFTEMDKKAYSTSEEGTDYNYDYAGFNRPDFDAPLPDMKKFKKQIEGSAENGNEQGWGNSVKTDVNKKFSKMFDEDPLGKAKDQAYQRAEQPVVISKGKLKEDFDRIKELMKYNDKTQ